MNIDDMISGAKESGMVLLDSLAGKKNDLVRQVKNLRSKADINDIKDYLAASRLSEIMRKEEEEEEMKKRSPFVTALAIIGAIAAVACIAFAVYRYFTPDYLDDFDEGDDDFDDEDDLFEDEDDFGTDTSK